MRRLLIIAILLLASAAAAQTAKTPPLWCQQGGQPAITQGLQSTSYVQITLGTPTAPCTVTVYVTGTTTIAALFTPSGGTLSNPFTANSDGSYSFFASTSFNYDIIMSGETFCTPLINGCSALGTQTTTVTLSNVSLQGGGGGGGGCGTNCITGATANGGLVVTGTTLGLILSCSNNQTMVWNSTAAAWGCGTISASPGGTSGQLQWNNAGSFAGVCSYDGVSTVTCVNLTATGNVNIQGTLSVAGVYQVLNSPKPSSALSCPAVGLTNFGVNSDGFIAECAGGPMTQPGDLIYQTNPSASDVGEPFVGAVGGSANPGATSVPQSVDLYEAYGSTDFCASLAAGKAAHLTDGVTLDGRSFGQQGTAIKCGVSTYVAGYYGTILLPGGTINVQNPATFLLQTHSDMIGQGEDATIIQPCVSPNANCNGVYFPTSATVPTYCLVGWTDDGVSCNFNANPTFDTRLSRVGIFGASNPGLICLANFVAQENESGPHDVSIHGCGNHSWGYAYGGANVKVTAKPTLQSTSASSTTACTNCSITPFSSIQTAGNTNITCGMWKPGGAISSISDGASNPYSIVSGSLGTDGAFSAECGYSQNINASLAGNTITYHFASATASYDTLMASEFTNIGSLGSLDQVAVAVTTTGNPTCPSITPSASAQGVYVVCAIEAEASGSVYATGSTSGCASSACTLALGTALQGMEWAYQATPAAITLNWTSSTTRRAIVISMDFIIGTNNGPGSQNHAVSGLDIYVGNGDTSTADSLLISGDTGAIGIAGPKEVRNVTATVNQGFTGTALTELIRVSGTATTFDNIHCENWQGANSYCFGIGEDAGFSGITINNLNAGNAASGTALLYLSAAFPSNSITITNLNTVGPNFPTDLIIDALNAFTDTTANEPKLSLYALSQNGCRFSGSGSGQCIVTTSGFQRSTFGQVSTQGIFTDYNCASQFGDGQAGSAAQYPCTFGFTTIPIGWQQIVVSSNAIVSAGTHVMVQDDPAALSYYGGFPSTCNTAQFLEFKILWKQPPLTAFPGFTEYPTQTVTSSSLTSNVVTLTGTFSGFGTPSATNAFLVRHAGDSTTALNTLGLVTGGNGTTTLTYSLIGSNTTGTGGTVQITPGFVIGASSAVSTTAECLSFLIFD